MQETGMTVTEEAARRMPSELTRTCSALSQGKESPAEKSKKFSAH